MGQTWYLDVDMQLFIVAPLFIPPAKETFKHDCTYSKVDYWPNK